MLPRGMHRWSEGAGAWCVDCGVLNPAERCLAADHTTPCRHAECQDFPCEEPGSNRHNPYFTHDLFVLAVRYYRVLLATARALPQGSQALEDVLDVLQSAPWSGASDSEGSSISDPIEWLVQRNVTLSKEASLCRADVREALAKCQAGDLPGAMRVLLASVQRPGL